MNKCLIYKKRMCCEVVRVFCICPCASGAETDVRESVLLCVQLVEPRVVRINTPFFFFLFFLPFFNLKPIVWMTSAMQVSLVLCLVADIMI